MSLEHMPVRLRQLADWFDKNHPDDANPEIQKDLREWANIMVTVQALIESSYIEGYKNGNENDLDILSGKDSFDRSFTKKVAAKVFKG